MGAAGLTSSSVEMASKGELGIELELDKVPCREENMTPYEMMLSESQERMLIILEDDKENKARKIFEKWDLDFVIIGSTKRFNALALVRVVFILLCSINEQAKLANKDFL